MFGAVIGAVFILLAASFVYLYRQFGKFGFIKRLAQKNKVYSYLARAVPLAVIILAMVFDVVNVSLAVIHLAFIWMICNFTGFIINKLSGKTFKCYIAGISAIVFTAVYLTYGLVAAKGVWETDYELTTGKEIEGGKLRIVQMADAHIGAIFDGEGFAEHLQVINKTKPDAVVITGDFIDNGTSKEDMLSACRAFRELDVKYGIYFSPGNHDGGHYGSSEFSYEDFKTALQNNGVTVLEDEIADVGGIQLIGRCDKSNRERMPIDKLVSLCDKEKYKVVLDHQPSDYNAEEKAGVDLVLSGHTHGGQMIPIGPVGELIGANDKTYGLEKRGNTSFIVTSGIADWEILFKTGTHSEFVVVDILQN